MACDRYLELLSARLDGALTEAEERELEEHLAACPDCRAVGAQLSALQGAFPELEEDAPPEGFARSVMERIRAEERKKVIPLFKRPQVRALAGLAACLVLVVGIYGISQLRSQEKMMLVTRSFQHDVMWEETIDDAGDVSARESLSGETDAPQVNAALADPELAEAPQIASYAAPVPEDSGTMEGMLKAAPNPAADGLTENRLSSLELSENTLAMDCFPEGAAELLPPETAVQPYPGGGTVYLDIPKDIYDQIQRLAVEQGMAFSCALTGDGGAENGPFTLIILEE